MSRQQLADATGIDPSNVGRALRNLHALGIVTWRPAVGRPTGKGGRCRARSWLRLPDAPEGWAYGRKPAKQLEHSTEPTAAELATLPEPEQQPAAPEKPSHGCDPITEQKPSHSCDPHPRDEINQGESAPSRAGRPSRAATTGPARQSSTELERCTDLELVHRACPDRAGLSADAAAQHDTERRALAGKLPALSPYYRRHLIELVRERKAHKWSRDLETALQAKLATATADAWRAKAQRESCPTCQGMAVILEGNTAHRCPTCSPTPSRQQPSWPTPTEPALQLPEQPCSAQPSKPKHRQLAGSAT